VDLRCDECFEHDGQDRRVGLATRALRVPEQLRDVRTTFGGQVMRLPDGLLLVGCRRCAKAGRPAVWLIDRRRVVDLLTELEATPERVARMGLAELGGVPAPA
jgi:hypothetical protein